MTKMQETFDEISARLATSGLRILHSGAPTRTWPDSALNIKTVLLVGHAGSEFWPHFRQSVEFNDEQPDPLDRWSKRIIQAAAPDMIFWHPSGGPPYAPIHTLTQGGAYSPSPIGMLAHAHYGLWTAFRGILLSTEDLPYSLVAPSPLPEVYEACYGACPGGALTPERYDPEACGRYMIENPQSPCWQGCQTRHACDLGQEFTYIPEHAEFHAQAFVRNLKRRMGRSE